MSGVGTRAGGGDPSRTLSRAAEREGEVAEGLESAEENERVGGDSRATSGSESDC